MNTRSRSRNKRNREQAFDPNNSVREIDLKRHRMEEQGTPGSTGGQIRDLSNTIMNQAGSTAAGTSAATRMNETNQGIENTVRAIVGNELEDMRRTMESLAKSVRNLSTMVTRNQVQTTERPLPTATNGGFVNGTMAQGQLADIQASGMSVNRPGSAMQSTNGSGHYSNSIANDQIKIRVDKFGINFDGNIQRLTIEEFIFRLECLQAQYAIPWEEVLRDFRLLVSGPALEWFWHSQKTRYFQEWSQLKEALLCQYRTTKSAFEAMRDLVDRKQSVNETIDSYFHNMAQLRARLVQPISDLDMVNILKVNVRDSIKLIVYPMSISTVEMLRTECKEAERNFPRRDPRSMPAPRPIRQVNEVFLDDYDGFESECQVNSSGEVAAIRFNNQKRPGQLVCWNCKEPGHVFMECPSTVRSLFCYRCGKPDTITPKCPVCQQGNHKRGVERSGELRPSENPGN